MVTIKIKIVSIWEETIIIFCIWMSKLQQINLDRNCVQADSCF